MVIKNLVNFTEKIFNKGFTDLSDKPFNSFNFMVKQIPALIKLKSYKSVYSLVSTIIKNEKLRRVFQYASSFGWRQSFQYNIDIYFNTIFRKKWGIHYSMGGTGSVVKALEKLMIEENIKIIKDAEVTEVITENKEVKSVRINNSQIISDYIICNSDPPSFYKKLIKSKKL